MDNTQSTAASVEDSAINAEEEQGMAQALEEYEKNLKPIAKDDFLTGRVISVAPEGVYVDVGYKTDGFVPANQVSSAPDVSPADVVKVGDEICVVVQRVDESEGSLILSKRRADNEKAWRDILEAFNNKTVIRATCTEEVKGGLIVDVGLRGFVPASHADLRPVKDLKEFVGEELNLIVLEVDKSKHKVVLSRKKAEEMLRESTVKDVMDNLTVGSIVNGTVARLANFGAFVDLGRHVDGLVHISELSWTRIKQPSDVVKVGQKVDVLVLKVDKEKGRISLSLRQAAPDPWMAACDKYKVDDEVEGRITRLAPKYAFIEVMPGVEGLIPVGEMDRSHVKRPEDVLKVDQIVKAAIISIDRDKRRMSLSIKRLQQPAGGHAEHGSKGPRGHVEEGGSSIGELLASKLGQDKVDSMLKGNSEDKAE